jgi:uncharacterized NAD(P)/FAD-binding protein YdhS
MTDAADVAPASTADVVIVGGGFSGAALAMHLLEQVGPGLRIRVYERRSEPGRGVAYSTEYRSHLLNVRAASMSLFAGQPDHFVQWATVACRRQISPDEYLPRRLYGDYIQSSIQDVIDRHEVEWIQDEIVSLLETPTRLELTDSRGRTVSAKRVVLAIGGSASPGPEALLPVPPEYYVRDPWSQKDGPDVVGLRSALIVGSGLTAIDQILALREKGFRGQIHVLSRHGLLPRSSSECPERKTEWSRMRSRPVLAILKRLREEIREADEEGIYWQALFDSARPDLQSLWLSLSVEERRRFLRHLRKYWDIHKHRMPKGTAEAIHADLEKGTLVVHAGHITGYAEQSDGVHVFYKAHKSEEACSLVVDKIYNCCGTLGSFRHTTQRLVTSMLQSGLARLDPYDLGIEISLEGAVLRADGAPSDCIYAVGCVCRGTMWESTAVPEIRAQITALATLLRRQFDAGDIPAEYMRGDKR